MFLNPVIIIVHGAKESASGGSEIQKHQNQGVCEPSANAAGNPILRQFLQQPQNSLCAGIQNAG
jgi:hypothetical protein